MSDMKETRKGIIRGIPHDKVESNLYILCLFIAILVAVGGIGHLVFSPTGLWRSNGDARTI